MSSGRVGGEGDPDQVVAVGGKSRTRKVRTESGARLDLVGRDVQG